MQAALLGEKVKAIRIPMLDLKREYHALKAEVDAAIAGVLDKALYVLGENVQAFEQEFAAYVGTKFAVGVGSGMDALHLALRALDIRPGDEVITVANTAAATAMAITAAGARPVFCEICEHSYTLDPLRIPEKITTKTRAIIPVHLFGQPADMESILSLANDRQLFVVEDACQGHGARWRGKKVGAFGHLGCFSFYPSKNLGCYGDGGMITTDDPDLAARLRMLRNYGQRERYAHCILGYNSRLDELQAAILRVKLRYLDAWNERRRKAAGRYHHLLEGAPVVLPAEKTGADHIYHLYVIRVADRNGLSAFLRANGVMTNIHYPMPLYRQAAFRTQDLTWEQLPITERCTAEILSLPLFPWITDEEIMVVSRLVREWLERGQP
jgi:dTDP-4-amino-4,6-dideoxygalactose transaminase